MQLLSTPTTTSSPSGPSQPVASNDPDALRPPSSSPPGADRDMHTSEELLAALKEAISRYRQGEEDGPYELMGRFSQAEYEKLECGPLPVVLTPAKVLRSGFENKFRPAYDKVAHRILLYGDPTRPHEATVASLRSLIANTATAFVGQLGQTADSDFNHFTPGDRFQSLFQFLGASTCNLVTSIKQGDELVQVRGVDRQRRALALEVAFSNESSGSAANETLAWIESGRVDFALSVKIEKNPDNQYDPFITVFFADCRERRPYLQGSSTPATRQRQVIHEWPCGSRSGIAPQAGPTIKQGILDGLNLQTATSRLSTNPALVRYDPDFGAEVIFHGDCDAANVLKLPFGQVWAPERRVPSDYLEFTDQDWELLQPFSVDIHLGWLRGEIIEHMKCWIEDDCHS